MISIVLNMGIAAFCLAIFLSVVYLTAEIWFNAKERHEKRLFQYCWNRIKKDSKR